MKGLFFAWLRGHPRGRKWLLRIGTTFLLYSLTGFLLIPALVKWQLRKQLSQTTHRLSAVRQVKFNPYALSLTVRGLALTEMSGAPFASFEELYVNFQLSSLFRRAWTFDEICLKEPRAEIVLAKDGQFNFANLFSGTNRRPPPQPDTKSALPRLLVFNLTLTNGHVGFADLSRKTPFRTAYEPINLHLTRFTTKPDAHSPYSLEASSDAGRGIAWAGTISAQPLASSGRLRIEGIQLPKHAPYLEDFTRAQLTDGTLDVEGNYRFASGTNGLDLVVSNLAVTVSKFALKDPDTGETVVTVPSLAVENAAASLAEKTAHVGAIKSAGAAILARRKADGAINLLSLLAANEPATATPTRNAASPAAIPGWRVVLDELALRDYAVQLEDRQLPKPGKLAVDQLALTVRGAEFPSNAPVQLDFSARVNAAGTVTMSGSVWPYSPALDAEVEVTGLDLRGFQPWVERRVKLGINSGLFNTKGRVTVAAPGGPGPKLHFAGGLAVTNLVTTDQALFKEFVRWDELAVEGVDLDLQPNKAKIAQMRFAGLKTSVIIGPDKRPNFLAVLPASSQTNAVPARAPTSATSAGDSFPIQLSELRFENASFRGDMRVNLSLN